VSKQKILNLDALWDRVDDFRRKRLNWWYSDEVAHVVKVNDKHRYMGQRARVLIDSDFTYQEDKIVVQPGDLETLVAYTNYHPGLSIVAQALVTQIVKRRIISKPKFAKKCVACGHEHQASVEVCTECESTDLRKPDIAQKSFLDAFIGQPNRQDSFRQIRESYLRDCIATGNAYVHKGKPLNNVIELWNEQSPYMWIATDDNAILGNGRYFCPTCSATSGGSVNRNSTTISLREAEAFDMECPFCSETLLETAYIYKRGQFLSRYGKDEIIHFNSDPRLPNPYGLAKSFSILIQLRSGTAMDKFNFDNYSLVRMAKIITFEKTNQEEANKVALAVLGQENELNKKAREQGWLQKMQRLLFLGSKGATNVLDAMPDPSKMQSLDWYDYWMVRVIAPRYGVQPIMINTKAGGSGSGGYNRMEIVVADDTTELWRSLEVDTLNKELLPDLYVYDYEFAHEPLHAKEPRDSAILMADELKVLEQAARLGIKAIKDDQGNLTWSGEVDLETYKLFAGTSDPTSTRVSEQPETDDKPREEGDEGQIPGEDGSGYKGKDTK
jgi:hypothetical protein